MSCEVVRTAKYTIHMLIGITDAFIRALSILLLIFAVFFFHSIVVFQRLQVGSWSWNYYKLQPRLLRNQVFFFVAYQVPFMYFLLFYSIFVKNLDFFFIEF